MKRLTVDELIYVLCEAKGLENLGYNQGLMHDAPMRAKDSTGITKARYRNEARAVQRLIERTLARLEAVGAE